MRPRGHHSVYEISRYGFPSAHVVVTIVACGLVAWVFGRDAPRPVRIALSLGVGVMAMGSGLARMILDAHWLSDIVAGFAVGALWLTLLTSILAWRPGRRPGMETASGAGRG